MTDLGAKVRKLFEQGFARGDTKVFDELIGDEYVNHDMPAPGKGPNALKAVLGQFREAFPDMAFEVLDIVEQGDRVATRGIFRGTHRGTFNGIPPTGKKVEVPWMDFWRAKNGKLVENWVRLDMMSMLTQLGVVPPPK